MGELYGRMSERSLFVYMGVFGERFDGSIDIGEWVRERERERERALWEIGGEKVGREIGGEKVGWEICRGEGCVGDL